MKAQKGQDGHIYLMPESEKQTTWAMDNFQGRERLAKMVLVGDENQGYSVQIRLKPE
jgi:hypothetical protein